MKAFGKNEYAARLPSALSVLAIVLVLILATRGWLIAEQSLLAAIILMTQLCILEKCRLAEIEGVYTALSGIGLVLWISWWIQGRSAWLVWTVPFIFNGLALLAKAPLHLVFFYTIIIAILIQARQVRSLFSAAHLAGVLIMMAIALAWMLPYLSRFPLGDVLDVWKHQSVERATGARIDLGRWLLNPLQGIGNHAPWIFLLPLLWRPKGAMLHSREDAVLKGTRVALLVCLVGVLLIPGMLPRYVQPLAVPLALLIAPVVWELPPRPMMFGRNVLLILSAVVWIGALVSPFVISGAVERGALSTGMTSAAAIFGVFMLSFAMFQLRKWVREPLHLSMWFAAICAGVMWLIAAAGSPWMQLKDNIRPFAAEIEQKLSGKPTRLVAYGVDDYSPLLATLFYLKHPYVFAPESEHIPGDSEYFLMRRKDTKKFSKSWEITDELAASDVAMDAKLVKAKPRFRGTD